MTANRRLQYYLLCGLRQTIRHFKPSFDIHDKVMNRLNCKKRKIISSASLSNFTCFFNWYSGGWRPIGSTRHCGHQWPIVPAPDDYDGEIGGMIGRGN
jgi:hypothetical protein